ncbi:MAG: thioredoxin domain-containing protein, partial [Oligoflexia bacterium]|nr:thioredoxin domain-containing protein [Oligoflexia bacterium]
MLSKKEKIVLYLLILTGLLIALKLSYIDYMVNHSGLEYKSFCNINQRFNCDAVAASRYSSIMGTPIAVIGVFANFLLLLFIPIGSRLTSISTHLKNLYLHIFLLYGLGIIYLASLSLFFISSFCLLCIAYWATSLITLAYLFFITDRPYFRRENYVSLFLSLWKHRQLLLLLGTIFIAAIIATSFYIFPKDCLVKNKDKDANQCEHFELDTNTAYLGQQYAPLEIYVYTDFQCPWCRRVHFLVSKLAEKYKSEIRFIRRDFPLDNSCNPMLSGPMHPLACVAAYYAKCAGRQGKYWQYHNEIYQNQETLTPETLINIAKMLSLDLNDLEKCINSVETKRAVLNEIDEGIKYNISSTPTFRIGNKGNKEDK